MNVCRGSRRFSVRVNLDVRRGSVQSNPYEAPATMCKAETHVDSSEASVVRRSRDLGLASLIMAGTVLIVAPIAILLAVQIWAHADRTPGIVLIHAWLARIGCLIVFFVGSASLVLGLSGLRCARRERVSAILPLAGIFLGIVATIAWVIAAIAVLNTTESLMLQFA